MDLEDFGKSEQRGEISTKVWTGVWVLKSLVIICGLNLKVKISLAILVHHNHLGCQELAIRGSPGTGHALSRVAEPLAGHGGCRGCCCACSEAL